MSSIFPTRSKPKTLTMKVMLQTRFLKPYLSLFLSSVGHSLDINTSTRGLSWTKPGLELRFTKGEKDQMVTRDEKENNLMDIDHSGSDEIVKSLTENWSWRVTVVRKLTFFFQIWWIFAHFRAILAQVLINTRTVTPWNYYSSCMHNFTIMSYSKPFKSRTSTIFRVSS